MNAKQAIEKWQSQDTIDAFQPWEIVEMLDVMAGRVIELEAAQQSEQADGGCPECNTPGGYHKTGCSLWLWEPRKLKPF